MFKSWDEYGGYDVENPMTIDSLWKRDTYDSDYLELCDFHIIVDTTKLSNDEENELVNALESVSIDEVDNYECDGELYVEVEPPDEPLSEDGDKWDRIEIRGFATEDVFGELCHILNSDFGVDYDVTYYKEI